MGITLISYSEYDPLRRRLAGIDVLAFFFADEAVDRDASDSGLCLVLYLLLGLSGTVPVAEKELALGDLLFEFLPVVAFLDIGLPEVESLLVDVCLDIVKKLADVIFDALKRHCLFCEGVTAVNFDSTVLEVTGTNRKADRHSLKFPLGELEARPQGVSVVDLHAVSLSLKLLLILLFT